ncbi:MAG: glycoside hydrolase family 5 protein [Lachnospiraceae bacterium]|nr:glycoside hydrolase family 5 protein [Lachnospiraceae bacterium]
MRNIRKLLWLGMLCLALSACGGKSVEEKPRETVAESESVVERESFAEREMQEDEKLTIADITPTELVADMKIGWSLGNTLDAFGRTDLTSEICWGNPVTTPEMIAAVVDRGFNVVRIPVTWVGHVSAPPEYKINDKWMARVKEVVDYAYDRGVYVIINLHHEEWLYPSYENEEEIIKRVSALWKQIAEEFKDYDEHLIFEGLNEPRKMGTNVEWNGGDKEGQEVVNHVLAEFVKVVRESGGNNTLRHLMIPGYGASSSKRAIKAIELPEDDKLIVSVHAYIPYDFALNTAGKAQWNNDTRDIDELMELLDKEFVSKGIPVIIGEFGAMNKENDEERIAWAKYYISAAKEIGVPCIWWDNNAFTTDGENFGLLDRRALNFPNEELVEALISSAQ